MRSVFMLALLLGVSFDAWAWRCGGWIVEEGQSLFEVGQKCGDPESWDRRTEWRVITHFVPNCFFQMESAQVPDGRGGFRIENRPRNVCTQVPVQTTVPVDVVEWYYSEEQYGNVPKLLRFENGRLVFIEQLWRQRNLR